MRQGFWAFGFLLLAILTGPALVLHVPPGHAPDETNHILRADSLLHGQFIGHRETHDGKIMEGLVADSALAQVITLLPSPLTTSPQPISPVQKWLATKVPWNDKPIFWEGGSIAGYMPLFYVPGAGAIALCRAAGLSPYVAFLAVRSANLYMFLLLGAVALYVARRGAILIFATLLLPMSLGLAASCSQDGMLIAGTACAVACLTRAMAQAPGVKTGWFAAACCLLATIAASKPPYAPLVLLALLPFRSAMARPARRLGVVILTALPAVAWTFLESRLANVPVRRAAAPAGPLWPGPRPAIFDAPDPAAQLHVLFAHKTLFVLLPLQTLWQSAGQLLQQGVGILDYLCLYLPAWLYVSWYVGLACALAAHLCSTPSRAILAPIDLALASTAVLLSIIAVGLALYLDWTPVGMGWIGGIQGRYFLPLLPVLSLCLPTFSRPLLSAALALPCMLAALVSAATLPGLVDAFYPLR